MGRKYNGDSCKSARIKISYKGLKPKVKFSYPDKKNQENFSMLPVIYLVWGILFFSCIFLFFTANGSSGSKIDFSNYSICSDWYKNYSIERCESIEGRTQVELLFDEIKTNFSNKNLLIFFLFIIPPILIYYPFKKYWVNVFPKYQALRVEGKLVIFKPKDLRKENQSYFVEIPLFKNVLLEYESKKDFSKYLDSFEIKEYNFKYVKGRSMKDAMKSKKKVNERLWYARFYFSEKPIDGELRVLFR